jgi:hypothetical protein
MLWLDVKYANMLSFSLPRFKVTRQKPYTAIFRCPLCGDSQKKKTKTRGYLLQKEDSLFFYCHNCNESMRFSRFIQTVEPGLHGQYMAERFMEKQQMVPPKKNLETAVFEKPKFVTEGPMSKLKKISQLEWDHPAKLYVVNRKIPNPYHAKLFYTSKFKAFVNYLVPGKYPVIENDEPRLIIPFIDKNGKVFGFQGRSFGGNGQRYITTILDPTHTKVFNYDTVDVDNLVYIFEGPIDAMFISNSLAMAGSDGNIDQLNIKPENVVMVYDNEPRNIQIVKKVEKSIEMGYNVVIWDSSLEHKDINDMVLAGMEPYRIKQMIKDCTYSGLQAKLMLNNWKRC